MRAEKAAMEVQKDRKNGGMCGDGLGGVIPNRWVFLCKSGRGTDGEGGDGKGLSTKITFLVDFCFYKKRPGFGSGPLKRKVEHTVKPAISGIWHVGIRSVSRRISDMGKERKEAWEENAGKNHEEEITNEILRPGTEKCSERRAQPFLDAEREEEPDGIFEDLAGERRSGRDGQAGRIQKIDEVKAEKNAEEGVGIFESGAEILRIGVGGKDIEKDKEKVGKGKKRDGTEEKEHASGPIGCYERAQNKKQQQREGSGENHVGGVVNPEIEPGERDQHRKKDAPPTEELLFCDEGDAAEEADRGLGMSAGEGVSCGGVYGVSDGREIGMRNPGAIDAEDQLEELIAKRTDKADEKKVIPGALIQAPEEKKRYGEHPDFIAEIGQNSEKRISERGANAFKEMQNGHTILRKKQG